MFLFIPFDFWTRAHLISNVDVDPPAQGGVEARKLNIVAAPALLQINVWRNITGLQKAAGQQLVAAPLPQSKQK